MLRTLLACLVIIGFATKSSSQILWTDPTFPTQDDVVTLYYNALEGNGEVAGVQPLYCHTGVITSLSENESDWQHVQGNWGTADSNVLMNYLGDNIYTFDFGGQSLADFYGLLAEETITSLAMVFRNMSGTLVGREADGGDIYYAIGDGSFSATILSPGNPSTAINLGESIEIAGISSESADLEILINGGSVATASAASELNYTFEGTVSGQYTIEFTADNGLQTVSSEISILVIPETNVEDPTSDVNDGINYMDDTTVILQFYAPLKENIFVVGDFNDWQFDLDYLMNQRTDGETFWLEIDGLTPGQEYRFQYHIMPDDMRVAEYYADKILDYWNDPWIPESSYPNLLPYPNDLTSNQVSVLQTAQTAYNWTDQSYEKPPQERLVIYELLVRDFSEERTYAFIQDSLPYLKTLGVTAIELLPVNEFEGNESWGYNPSFYFAPDKYYGSEDAMKALVNAAHNEGIAVVMDIALNHSFGQNPQVRMYFNPQLGDYGQPTPESPWFNEVPKHDFNVGYDYDHESSRTRDFCKRVLGYWIEEYHIDGYRLDLSKGFTQNNTLGNVAAWGAYDQSRVDILNDYRNHIMSIDEETYIILEHFANNDEEIVLANTGFMLWGNLNHEYNEATMGYSSNLNWGSYQDRGWNNPNLVTYMESHDEERLMYKNLEFANSNGAYDITDMATALRRIELASCFLIPLPGPKMIWQFGELGYDYSINYCWDNNTIDEECRTYAKPVRWDYYEEINRKRIYNVMAALNHLKATEDAFITTDYTIDVAGTGKRIHLNHPSMDVVVAGNFDVTGFQMSPDFQHTGTWYDYFSGESFEVTDQNVAFYFEPGEYHIYTDQFLETPVIETSIDEITANANFTMYPNPASSSITLVIGNDIDEVTRIQLLDLQGRELTLIADRQNLKNAQITWEIPTELARGMYFVRVNTNKIQSTLPLIVE